MLGGAARRGGRCAIGLRRGFARKLPETPRDQVLRTPRVRSPAPSGYRAQHVLNSVVAAPRARRSGAILREDGPGWPAGGQVGDIKLRANRRLWRRERQRLCADVPTPPARSPARPHRSASITCIRCIISNSASRGGVSGPSALQGRRAVMALSGHRRQCRCRRPWRTISRIFLGEERAPHAGLAAAAERTFAVDRR